MKLRKIGRVKKEELVGKKTLEGKEEIQTCPALALPVKGMSQILPQV